MCPEIQGQMGSQAVESCLEGGSSWLRGDRAALEPGLHPEPVGEKLALLPGDRVRWESFSEKAPLPSHETGRPPNSTDAATPMTLSRG